MQEDRITPQMLSLLRSGQRDEEIAQYAGLTLLEVLELRALVASRPLRSGLRFETCQ